MSIKIHTQTTVIPYIEDSLAVFGAMNKPNSLLLESAEIDSKDNLKSILLTDPLLRIECHGLNVFVESTSTKSASAMKYLADALCNYLTTKTDATLHFTFHRPGDDIDEDTRLKCISPFHALRVLIDLGKTSGNHEHSCFLGGIFGYDMIGVTEQLPNVPTGENSCPDFLFYLAESMVISDHQLKTSQRLDHQYYDDTCETISSEDRGNRRNKNNKEHKENNYQPLTSKNTPTKNTQQTTTAIHADKSDEQFITDVLKLKTHIQVGDIFQVVPSRTFSLSCVDTFAAYRQLKLQNPSPYMFFMKDQEFDLFGASPESAVKYSHQTNDVEVYPIAGTRQRGLKEDGSIDIELDSRIEQELRSDKKELAEHMMLVDLARNDIARVAVPGTRYVCNLQKVDRYSHVMHLVSRVKGQLSEGLDALHAYQACMNMGTLVGAPKLKAATLIREVEQKRRGSYGGAVGYLSSNGDMDTCIVIRSAFVKDNTAYIQAGAGVVYDSDPQAEADETRAKAQAVISAIISSYTYAENAPNNTSPNPKPKQTIQAEKVSTEQKESDLKQAYA
ncbi:MAG: anthranilate synthase component I [Alteromonadaceae bacterium]|nr:MAG: anthranilate synthase component I [Alteromonadaceae bacterium]